jgi:alpha-L-fucosidase
VTKGGALYAYVLAWPSDSRVTIKSLATNSPLAAGRRVANVELLGAPGRLTWTQTDQGLEVTLPSAAPAQYAVGLRIDGIA